ncbi:MAG TPA: DUF6186 family protein [Acidimicrobiales bacterium]
MTSALTYGVWAALAAAGIFMWWLSYVRPSMLAHPGDVVGRVVSHPVARVVVVLGFLFLGWHTFAR